MIVVSRSSFFFTLGLASFCWPFVAILFLIHRRGADFPLSQAQLFFALYGIGIALGLIAAAGFAGKTRWVFWGAAAWNAASGAWMLLLAGLVSH